MNLIKAILQKIFSFLFKKNEQKVNETGTEQSADAIIEDPEEKQIKTPNTGNFPGYYQIYFKEREKLIKISERDIDKFNKDLKNNRPNIFDEMTLGNLELKLFSAASRVQLFGELPISKSTYKYLNNRCRNEAYFHGRYDPKRVPPTLFITGMVFCARYTHEDSLRFREPYLEEVWQQNKFSSNFWGKCRKHFYYCLKDFEESQGKYFVTYEDGDVVRPVQQHSIIPYAHQEHFANWIIEHHELISKCKENDLNDVIRNVCHIGILPFPFSRLFTQRKNNEPDLGPMIQRIAKAVKIYKATQKGEEAISQLGTMLEKQLFKATSGKIQTAHK